MKDEDFKKQYIQEWPAPDQEYINELIIAHVMISREPTDSGNRLTLSRIYRELVGYLGADTQNQIDNMEEVMNMIDPPKPKIQPNYNPQKWDWK